ncbi:epimerase family protein SDR39U1-like protein [Cucumis melo var. makuwa]|uniref:Epimerase family protein SDR39U1-like protein n=1 Tax=Cucumis melo var. makuwa TaxID=1194695 RepID=A0A5A7ST20_CUCMM|nr:epimerase family protein SDR39U1-like protein [Cucumis melo var. makuwa]
MASSSFPVLVDQHCPSNPPYLNHHFSLFPSLLLTLSADASPTPLMDLPPAISFSWSRTVSHSLRIPQHLTICGNRFRVFCAIDATKMKNQLTVSITGATGFIGRRLVQRLHADKHNIRVLTCSKSKAKLIFPAKEFPGIMIAEELGWKDCIQGSDGVVNLAGMPISTRWFSEVVSLISDAPDAARPTVLVSATAVGYYLVCASSSLTQLSLSLSVSLPYYVSERLDCPSERTDANA